MLRVIGETGAGEARRKGRSETNPIELTCFLSTTYSKGDRNKPKGDKSHGFNHL